MSEKDAAKEDADRVGGWENLARGLHELYTTGENTSLKKNFNRTECERIARALNRVKRGAKVKRDVPWFWMVEGIINAANVGKPPQKDVDIIREHLELFYGKKLNNTTWRQDQAVKTVQNQLAKFRREEKLIRKKYDPALDPGQTFLKGYEEPPDGCEYIDDPRLHDLD